jgi:hypothetical protein
MKGKIFSFKFVILAIILFACLFIFSTTSFALIPGDFGSAGGGPPDGVVDFEDLMIFAMAYGSTPIDANWNEVCDIASLSGVLEPDGVINFEDLMIFAIHYGEECPTVTISVADEVFINGKTYVRSGSNSIVITFSSPVENPVVKVGTTIIVVFPSVDKKDWIGIGTFTGSCDPVLIEVSGVCGDFCDVKSVTVDSGNPYAELKVTADECTITGYSLTIDTFNGCCGDDCSGFADWAVEIWDETPWGDYCAPSPFVEPIACGCGASCPIEFTTNCIDFFDKDYWVTITLLDIVGNVTSYYGKLIVDLAGGGLVSLVEQYCNPSSLNCVCSTEDPDLADLVIGDCDGTPADECWVE